jgi:hypothetical protein
VADSNYIVYVDESGDPGLTAINPEYPIFVVAFCIVEKTQYIDAVAKLLKLKFDTFGHDMTVMHEREIRKRIGDFAFIRSDRARGARFLTNLTNFVKDAPFMLVAAVIRKTELVKQYEYPNDPCELALTLCLERTHLFLGQQNQQTHTTHVIVEMVTTSGECAYPSRSASRISSVTQPACSSPIWWLAPSARKC